MDLFVWLPFIRHRSLALSKVGSPSAQPHLLRMSISGHFFPLGLETKLKGKQGDDSTLNLRARVCYAFPFTCLCPAPVSHHFHFISSPPSPALPRLMTAPCQIVLHSMEDFLALILWLIPHCPLCWLSRAPLSCLRPVNAPAFWFWPRPHPPQCVLWHREPALSSVLLYETFCSAIGSKSSLVTVSNCSGVQPEHGWGRWIEKHWHETGETRDGLWHCMLRQCNLINYSVRNEANCF